MIAPRDPDGISVAALRELILRELTPDRVAEAVADRALDLFRRSSMHLLPDAAAPGASGPTWFELPALGDPFREPMDEVRHQFGAGMTLNAFVMLDDNGMRWRPVTHAVPAAVDVLKAMQDEGLLADSPERLGRWGAQDD